MADEVYHTDLRLIPRGFDRLVSDREYVDLTKTPSGDLGVVSGRENLVQAILNRIFTRKGELARLGHPNYGSRVYQLVGEPNNLRTQGRAELFLRECLRQEDRIAEITFIQFADPGRLDTRSTLQVEIGIQPVGAEAPFSLVIPINL